MFKNKERKKENRISREKKAKTLKKEQERS